MNIISSDYEMLWHSVWPQYEYRSLWPIFHGPVILLNISKIIWHMHIIFPDYEVVWHNLWPQYDCKSLWPIFHGLVILLCIWKPTWHMNIIHFQIMKWFDTIIHLNMNVTVTYISWSSDFALYLEDHLTYVHIIFPDYEMVWHNLWPQYDCNSLWPEFHGPVSLPYIWKPIWHMNNILPDYEMVWHSV